VKLLAYILSLYLLVLPAIPCCATDDCNDAEVTEQKAHQTKKENESSNACSPFAMCGNSAGFTITEENLAVCPLALPFSIEFNDFISYRFPQYISFFWKPPRLA
jgi:hypothetical protein